MSIKKYIYTDIEGVHWPDTHLGANEYYSIDFSSWLTNEGDELDSVSWEIPSDISSSDDFLSGDIAHVKISADTRGIHKIVCTMTSSDVSRSQTNIVPMYLKVF